MKAVFLDEPGKTSVRDIPQPVPGAGEVLVRVKAVGVCGSDVHFFEHGRVGDFVVREPLILGHECAGEVAELGPGVRGVELGQHVALEPQVPCRCCRYCKEGHYNLCQGVRFMAAPPDHGAFAEYVVVPQDFAHPLVEGLSWEVGAMVEPLAVGMHAVARANLRAGERVAVLGAGTIGLLAIAAAAAAGASRIVAVDLVERKLELAKRMGATEVINAAVQKPEDYLSEDGYRSWAQVVLDCAGFQATMTQGIEMAAPGGRLALVGMGAECVELPLIASLIKELNFYGVFRYANVHGKTAELLNTGQIDPSPLITHRFHFPEVQKALETAADRERSVKVMVLF